MNSSISMPGIVRLSAPLGVLILTLGMLILSQSSHAADSTLDKAKVAAQEVTDNLWKSIDEQRLKNRTPDQIVAWVLMGLLVGGAAGMATSLKTTGLGKVGRLLLGLAGAFIGGIVVSATRVDFGWGPVLIRYEELFFSFAGALLLIVSSRIMRARWKRPSK
jgi:uncharacterized membrane protein YeaQ/YmgE (transglycosylase-associated protein family)